MKKHKSLDEEKCVVCGRRTKDPFAELIMGFNTSLRKVSLRYCCWNCLESDHINQFIDILLHYGDNNLLNDVTKLIKARREVLVAEAKSEVAESRLQH